jgi:hypothetical protein
LLSLSVAVAVGCCCCRSLSLSVAVKKYYKLSTVNKILVARYSIFLTAYI